MNWRKMQGDYNMKQNTHMIAILALVLASSFASAEPVTAQQGLEKIKTNLENSKENKKEYEKNLGIVSKNVNEIVKAKTAVMKQKEVVSGEILQNNESLKKVLVQERDINVLISQEKEKMATEAKQLEQFEKMMTQVKQNQVWREAIIADYQNQLKMTTDEKKAWKDRETELRTQESKTIQSLRGLASEENNWTNKKKGYIGETKRWSAEADKQQKIHDTYQGLANDQK
jgi:predicted  nucleic acid-binding Zn-ribbon protein